MIPYHGTGRGVTFHVPHTGILERCLANDANLKPHLTTHLFLKCQEQKRIWISRSHQIWYRRSLAFMIVPMVMYLPYYCVTLSDRQ